MLTVFRTKTQKILAVISLLLLVVSSFSLLLNSLNNEIIVEANGNCTNATQTTPTWNPFPLNLNDPNPQPNGTCTDIPMISHFPIAASNPRARTYGAGDTVTVHLYYNNGASVNSANNIMNNPRARLEMTQENATTYRLRAFLSGSGGNANSSQAQYGGDIIINVPANTTLEQVRRNTLWYPQAPRRLESFNNGGNTQISLNIDNNPAVTNPLLSPNGFQIYTPTDSSIAQQQSAGLRAGFEESGYFLMQWRVNPAAAPVNNPPVLPGQEITIIRGDSGAFNPLNGTDPDGDVPLSYTPNNLPSFCTYNSQNNIINCQSNAQTPVRTVFTVTPIDSRGLVGTPGTFIVNIIEPGLNITKNCVKLGTTTPCNQAALKPSEEVTYTINVSNSGQAPARNVIVIDDYPQEFLENIRDLNPAGTVNNDNGSIRWELGTIDAGGNRTLTYNATIRATTADGSIVENVATVSADGIPPREARTQFPVGQNLPVLATSDKICFKKGGSIPCDSANLTIGDSVSYFINVRNTGTGTAQNVVVTDTYDRLKLRDITNIQPTGILNTNNGTIIWNLGNIPAGETRTLTFDATIASTVTNGQVILNVARITADNLPPQEVSVDFPVGLPPVNTLDRTGGIAFWLFAFTALAAGAGYYYYNKSINKTAKRFSPARSSESKADSSKISVKK
jgi:uncharacterized repeat protein (TIGR01451 family)